jgi:hypothetical protein
MIITQVSLCTWLPLSCLLLRDWYFFQSYITFLQDVPCPKQKKAAINA